MARDSLPAQLSLSQVRPFQLWVWVNVLLYAGYAGFAVVVLFLTRASLSLWGPRSRDGMLFLSLSLLAILVFSCLANGEVERVYHFAAIFLLLPAIGGLVTHQPEEPSKGFWEGVSVPALFCVVLLNLVNTLVLEVTVLDHW